MNEQFQTVHNVNTMSVQTPPLTLENTLHGGIRIGVMQEFLPRSTAAAGGVRWGYVNRVTTATELVMGTFLKPTFSEQGGVTGATWQNDGGERPFFVPPGFKAVNLDKLAAGESASFRTGMVAMLCVQIGGLWYLSPTLNWVYRDPPPSGSQVRCP